MSIFNNKKPLPPKDYEEYIKKIVLSYENKLSDQKDRIFGLLEENRKITEELNTLKEKDIQISQTLTIAVQKAKEIEDAAKAKYNMEIERLKIFHNKWVSYYDSLKDKLVQNEDRAKAESFINKMDEILGFSGREHLSQKDSYIEQQYEEELQRLNNIDQGAEEAATADDDGIDMEEVLNPKNLPKLEDIIKQMGILDK